MPRSSRHYISGHVWHITHRRHKKEFLLKFAKRIGRLGSTGFSRPESAWGLSSSITPLLPTIYIFSFMTGMAVRSFRKEFSFRQVVPWVGVTVD
jgi:hypothetical protein